MNLPGAVSSARLPERVRKLATLVNIHYAGAGLLLLINLYLAIQLGFAWHTQSASGADALAQSQTALRTADLQARPLQGLDSKLALANGEADAFYTRRLPASYSGVLTELGALTHREGVKLTRVQYAQAPILDGTPNAVTEVRMDSALTGDYSHLVHFVNALERDPMFFLISGVALTGQQGGNVGLRLRLTTYLRPGAILGPDTSADTSQPSSQAETSPAGSPNAVANSGTVTDSSLGPNPAASPVRRAVPARQAPTSYPDRSPSNIPSDMQVPAGLHAPPGQVRHLPPPSSGGGR